MECKYGFLNGVSYLENYENGAVKYCTLSEENILETEYGRLIPQYRDDHERKSVSYSLCFYQNGNLEKVYLQEQTYIKTDLGILPAELVLFHENGKIRKIFPLNGRLTGFWSENHEYKLAEKIKIETPIGTINEKIMSISFYDSGKIRNITFWPRERVEIQTPIGKETVRIGISFYESGALKSFEPAKATKIITPIGEIIAYDVAPLGIHGDTNSLTFFEEGNIKSLYTSTDEVVIEKGEKRHIYSPDYKIGMCNDEVKDVVPLKIEFSKNRIYFNKDKDNHSLEDSIFKVKNSMIDLKNLTFSCH
jgi:hypothetical protein